MMHSMRTTVDLPPVIHRRAVQLARDRGQSLSAVVADLTVRGLAQLDQPLEVISTGPSGFPVISIGRRITSDEVATLLDDE